MKNADLIRDLGDRVGPPDLGFGNEGTLAQTVGEDIGIVLEEEAEG